MSSIDADLITAAEAAEILRVSHRVVIRRVERGELTPVRKLPGIRGAFLFDAAQIRLAAEPAA